MQGHGVGNLAYDFTLKDLEGQVYSLKALRGKRVVQVVFWATWCGPCVEEIPQLREIYTKYHARGLEVFGVAVNMNQTPDGVRAFARQYEMNYPVLWDSGDKVMDRYRVSSIPRNFLIGKDGVIRYAGTGLPQGYDGLVERLLADEGPARTAAR
jgi:peroxiredoxin